MSILLDFDKEIQKNLTKYFINNALNTLYREEDHHYWLGKIYNAQDIRKKIWLSIEWIYKDHDLYLSIEDCKKIAGRAWLSDQELSDILYDVCLFKLWDDSKASASFHRKREYWLEEIKKHLLWSHKEDIENIQYIYKEGRNSHSQPFYSTKDYDLLTSTQALWLDLASQKKLIEDTKIEWKTLTQDQIWLSTIRNIWEATTAQYDHFLWNIDMDLYKAKDEERHISSYKKENPIYLVRDWKTISISNIVAENQEILWNINISIYEKFHEYYDNDLNMCRIDQNKIDHYEVNFFSSTIEKEYIDAMIKIFKKNDMLKLNIHILPSWNNEKV